MTYLISSLLAFFAGNSRDRSVEKKLKSSLVNKKLVAFLTLLVAFTSSFVYAQPANDNCSGAILLNCGTTGLAGSTVGAVLETTPGPLSTASGMGVWYYFVGDGTPTVISSTGTGGFDHEMVIYSGSCGSLTYITNLDVGIANGTETYSFTSTIGVNYYVYVSYWFSGDISTTGTFTVSLSCTGSPCSGTPNPGTATISSATGCTGQSFTLSATGLSTGAGLTYQWQSAPTASGPWTNIPGGTTASFATSSSAVGQTFYQLISTCAGVSSTSSTVSYTASSCGIVPTSGVSYLTSCGTTVYDSGGPSGNYSDNENGTLVIRPTSMWDIITVSGTCDLRNNNDFLRIDEGEDSNTGTFYAEFVGDQTINYTAQGPGIPLSIHFVTNGSNVDPGFQLTVSCVCAKPTAITLATTDAPCGGTGSVTVSNVTPVIFEPWIMTTNQNNTLPALSWLPTAPATNAWISGNANMQAANNNQVEITAAATSQSGALVYESFGQNRSILNAWFDIFAGNGTSADGIAFSYGPGIASLNPVNAFGSPFEVGVGSGLMLSFDSYPNGTDAGFPSCNGTNYRNIYLSYNSVTLACYSLADYTGWRNTQRPVNVYITQTGLVYVDLYLGAAPTTIFSGVQLPAAYVSANKSTWRAAFTARTGGETDQHRVDNVNFYHETSFEYSINGTTWQTSSTFSGLTSGTYNMYVRYKGNTSCSFTQAFTISAPLPSTAPTSITGNTLICDGGSTTLTSAGGTLGTEAEDIWYEGACPTECYKQEWLTQPFPSFANMTVNSLTNGVLNVTSTNNDPMIDMSGLGSFDPTVCRYVNIRYRVTAGTANNVEIFFYNTANPAAVGGQTGFGTLISDNTWRTVSVDMWADPEYQTGGNITGWRFDWATAAGVTMDIDFITLSNLPIVGAGPSITVAPTTNTTYFTLKQGPCNTTTCVSQLVTVSANPIVTITGSTTACNGTAVTLTAAGGGTYLWSTGETTAAISVTPTATTTYTVSVTLNGCTLSSTHTLTITDNIATTFTQITSQCQGSSGVALPASSTNSPAITGTWSPATISTTTVGTTNYVFTPTAGVCATPFTMPIQVVSCAQIEPCNILVYQIGNNATATSSAPVTILEFPPNFTNTTTPSQITAPVTGSNVLTNVSGGAAGNVVSILTGYMNTNNGFTAIPGYSDPDNTANIETSSDNERVNLINAAQSTTVVNAINTYFGSSSIIRGAVPIDATRFYCFGAGPTQATSGIFYWDGTAFTQIYTDANCVNTNTTNNIRSIDIFNGQLYLLRRPATGVLGFLFAVGNGLPTTLSTLSSAIATHSSTSAQVNSFSISPDGTTMYTTDNAGFSTNGITKWRKTANGSTFARVTTTPQTPTSLGSSGSASANKYLGLAVDWNATPVKLYATSSTGSSTGGMFLVALTESAGIGANAATWPAASAVQYYSATTNCTGCKYTGVDFAPTITANLSASNGCVGTPVAVTASAIQSAVAPLTYQWYKIPSPNTSYVDYYGSVAVTPTDGTGGTTATFTPSVAGTYFCEVIGATCAKYRTPPVIVTDPPIVTASADACVGSTATITVTATGVVAPFNISWTGTATGDPAGTEILASGGTYTTPALGSGTYNISVTSANGCVVTPAAITINCGSSCTNPTIDTQPTDITECLNAAQQLSVTASGTTLTYQWYSNTSASTTGGTLLTGETNATYTPPSGTAGTFYFYVIVNSSTCATTSNVVTVIVNPNNTAGTPSSSPNVCLGTAILPSITIATTGATGIGTATGLPTGVSAAWLSNVITISGTPTATGTFNYTIPLSGGCGTVNATGTITLIDNNTAGTPSSSPSVCLGTAIASSITIATTGATGIGTATGLPTGVSAAWLGDVITISGTPTATGTFNYTIPLSGGCGTVNATGTITVIDNNTAGTPSSSPTVCLGTAISPSITIATTGATGIGTETGLPTGVSAAWLGDVITISGTPTATGTFNYTIPLSGGCGTVNATGTITVNPNPTAGISGSTTFCTGGTTSLTATGGGTYNWSNSLGTNATVSVGTAGTYTVTVTLNSCTAESSVIVSSVSCNNFGEFASAVYVQTCNNEVLSNAYYNTTGDLTNQISPTPYQAHNFGSYFQNSGKLKLQGGEMKTWKNNPGNVCGVTLYYRIYPSLSAPSGAFSAITLPFYENCSSGSFPNGGPCGGNDQKWQRPGNSNPLANIDLTNFTPDTYVLEIYYDIQGSNVSNSTCETTSSVNNGGANFISNFTIVATPTASNTGAYCAGQTIQLNSSNGGTAYNWAGPNTYSNSTQNPTISSATTAMAGTYTVTVSLANNCTATAQTIVVVNTIPTVDVTCANICAGATTTVTATPTPAGTYTYNWTVPSGAAAQGSGVASFTTGVTGTYSVIVTNSTTGCVSLSDACTISIQAQPSLIFLSPP